MDDPWFIWMKGKEHIRVTPRNAKGWASFLAMMVVGLAPLLLLSLVVRPHWWSLPLQIAFPLVVIVVGLRLAWTRSEVIDLDLLGDELKDFRKWRDQQKRR